MSQLTAQSKATSTPHSALAHPLQRFVVATVTPGTPRKGVRPPTAAIPTCALPQLLGVDVAVCCCLCVRHAGPEGQLVALGCCLHSSIRPRLLYWNCRSSAQYREVTDQWQLLEATREAQSQWKHILSTLLCDVTLVTGGSSVCTHLPGGVATVLLVTTFTKSSPVLSSADRTPLMLVLVA